MSFFREVRIGITRSLGTTQRRALFLCTAALSFAVLFSIPVYGVENNGFKFQWSIMGWTDVLILLFLSCLLGLVVVLQLENWKCCRARRASVAPALGSAGTGMCASLIGGLFATAACSSCIAGLLGLFGISAAVSFKLLEYQNYIVLGAMIITAIIVIWTARKIARGSCNVPVLSRKP